MAIVVGTGWNTRKGKLLGSVLWAPEEPDKFSRDFLKMLFFQFFFHIVCVILLYIVEMSHDVY